MPLNLVPATPFQFDPKNMTSDPVTFRHTSYKAVKRKTSQVNQLKFGHSYKDGHVL